MKAVLSENGNVCSCSECPSNSSYYWYKYNAATQTYEFQQSSSERPTGSGTYRCRAVWKNARSDFSNPSKGSGKFLVMANDIVNSSF